jgi:murein DD-endopeptidase MepM/ murein hydrolase activator NlpD
MSARAGLAAALGLAVVAGIAAVALGTAAPGAPPATSSAAPLPSADATTALATATSTPRPTPPATALAIQAPAATPARAATAPATTAPTAAATRASASPRAPAAAAVASPRPSATTPPAATPRPAPTSATGFKPRATVVSMAFPVPATSGYRYGPAWRVPRAGIVYPYNQIRGVTANGILLRAHDGVDIEVPNGTRVLAPFAGVIVNPAALWKPWDAARYGNVVVVRSTEPASRGYYALMAHLSRRDVRVGDRVARGAVVGRTGQTGNAAGTVPHLHFELRAPFRIAYAYAGVRRTLDVFDPLPSLHEADPAR